MTEPLGDDTPAALPTFNEGDHVYIISTAWGGRLHRAVVDRVTKTQAIIRNERFNRRTGLAVGSRFVSRIEHPTPNLDAKYRRLQIRELARRVEKAAANVRAGIFDADRALHEAYKAWADAVAAEEVRDV